MLTALASEEDAMPAADAPPAPSTDVLGRLQQLLGLPPETSEEDAFSLVERMVGMLAKVMKADQKTPAEAVADPSRFVPVEAVLGLMRERLQEQNARAEERAREKVDSAFRRGAIPGAMRDWALALCRSDEARFDEYLDKMGSAFARLLEPSRITAAPPPAFNTTRCQCDVCGVCAPLILPLRLRLFGSPTLSGELVGESRTSSF